MGGCGETGKAVLSQVGKDRLIAINAACQASIMAKMETATTSLMTEAQNICNAMEPAAKEGKGGVVKVKKIKKKIKEEKKKAKCLEQSATLMQQMTPLGMAWKSECSNTINANATAIQPLVNSTA